jgi:hypothetical protein
VIALGFGTVRGAVYSPLVLMVPTVEFPPVTWLTSHRIAALLAWLTVAVNC